MDNLAVSFSRSGYLIDEREKVVGQLHPLTVGMDDRKLLGLHIIFG
mgnify:CR=1 FL=1